MQHNKIKQILLSKWTILACLLFTAGFFRVIHISFLFGDFDEGVFLSTVRSFLSGNQLYTPLYYSQMPLFIYITSCIFFVTKSLIWIRLFIAVLSLVGIGVVFMMMDEYIGRYGAAFAAIYLAVDQFFLLESRTFQSDMVWVVFTLLSLFFLLRFDKTKQYIWIAVSGVFFGCSIMVKSDPVFMIVICVYLVLLMFSCRKNAVCATLSLAGGAFLIIFISLIHIDLHALYFQAVASKLDYISLSDIGNPMRRFLFSEESILFSITLIESISFFYLSMKRKVSRFLILLYSWFFISLITTLVYNPLFTHHFIFLIVPGAMTGGAFIEFAAKKLDRFSLSRIFGIFSCICMAFILMQKDMYIIEPKMTAYDQTILAASHTISAHTTPDDYIISDEPLLLYITGRNTPPDTVELSAFRIVTGRVNPRSIITATRLYKVDYIVAISGRLRSMKNYIRYADRTYTKMQTGNNGVIYIVKG